MRVGMLAWLALGCVAIAVASSKHAPCHDEVGRKLRASITPKSQSPKSVSQGDVRSKLLSASAGALASAGVSHLFNNGRNMPVSIGLGALSGSIAHKFAAQGSKLKRAAIGAGLGAGTGYAGYMAQSKLKSESVPVDPTPWNSVISGALSGVVGSTISQDDEGVPQASLISVFQKYPDTVELIRKNMEDQGLVFRHTDGTIQWNHVKSFLQGTGPTNGAQLTLTSIATAMYGDRMDSKLTMTLEEFKSQRFGGPVVEDVDLGKQFQLGKEDQKSMKAKVREFNELDKDEDPTPDHLFAYLTGDHEESTKLDLAALAGKLQTKEGIGGQFQAIVRAADFFTTRRKLSRWLETAGTSVEDSLNRYGLKSEDVKMTFEIFQSLLDTPPKEDWNRDELIKLIATTTNLKGDVQLSPAGRNIVTEYLSLQQLFDRLKGNDGLVDLRDVVALFDGSAAELEAHFDSAIDQMVVHLGTKVVDQLVKVRQKELDSVREEIIMTNKALAA